MHNRSRRSTALKKTGILALVAIGALALSGCVDLTVNKAKVTIKPGKSKTVKVTAFNHGNQSEEPYEIDYENAKVCAKSSKPKLVKIKPKCITDSSFEYLEEQTGQFKIKVTKKAAKKKTKTYKVTFTSSADNQHPVASPPTATVKVKVPKTKVKKKK